STVSIYSVFFFQAEDGIRHRNVTGVQTCALPILMSVTLCLVMHGSEKLMHRLIPTGMLRAAAGGLAVIALTYLVGTTDYNGAGKIGRASWRERAGHQKDGGAKENKKRREDMDRAE